MRTPRCPIAICVAGASGSCSTPWISRLTRRRAAGPRPCQRGKERDHSMLRSSRRFSDRARARLAREGVPEPSAGLFDGARVREATRGPGAVLLVGLGVGRARRDRSAGVGLGSVRVLPAAPRLCVRRLELVRDPAGESVPAGVARPAGRVVARAGAVSSAVRPRSRRLRVPFSCAGLSSRERLVLTVPPGNNAPRVQADVAWIDYRHSVARSLKRRDAGEQPVVCEGCRTEVDVDQVVHSPRCKAAA